MRIISIIMTTLCSLVILSLAYGGILEPEHPFFFGYSVFSIGAGFGITLVMPEV